MAQTERRWERFYTEARCQNGASGLVDQIFIDVVNKVYLFYQEVNDYMIDGYDEFDNELCSIYVSTEVIDIILQGLKASGYKQEKIEE